MENTTTVAGSEVQNLITKFYYKDNHLCFQILLHFGLDKTMPFQEFSDYTEYKRVYGELLQLKNSNGQITVPVAKRKNTVETLL